MTNKIFCISLLVACSISCFRVFSQDISYKEIDLSKNDIANSVIQQSDGTFLFCGESDNSLFILKTKLSGDTIWCFKLKNTVSIGYSVKYNEKNEIVAVGSIFNGSLNTLVVKLDQQGNLKWKREFDNPNIDIGYSISPASDGAFIVTGQARLVDNNDADLAYYKLDSLGKIVWSKFINWGNIDWGYSIVKTSDHNYMIAGLADGKYLVLKINESGDTIYSRTFNDFTSSSGASDIIEYKNNFYLIGGFGLIKLDFNGEKIFSNNNGGYKFCIIDDKLYCIGWEYLSPYDNYMSIVLEILNLNGDLLIKKKFSQGDDDWGYGIIACNNGSILLTGKTLNKQTHRHNIPLFFINQDGYFVNIDKIVNETKVLIYPNPVLSGENIIIERINNGNIKIMNIHGKIVHQQTIRSNTKNSINTSALTSGIYIISLTTNNNEILNDKIQIK